MCEILRQKVGRHIQTSIWRNKQTQKNITFQHKGWDRKGGCGNLVKNKIKKNKTKIKTQAGLQPNNWKVNYAVQWREQMEKKMQQTRDIYGNQSELIIMDMGWYSWGQGQPRGQQAYAVRAIPVIGLPVLWLVEWWRAHAGMRRHRGHGGGVGLVRLG